jgi:putative addiction module component (TIGR02574 family)
MPNMQSELTEQAKKLSISDRINLVEEIWDTIAEENQAFELSDSQKRELDRRLETARSNAGQGAAFGRTWEEIICSANCQFAIYECHSTRRQTNSLCYKTKLGYCSSLQRLCNFENLFGSCPPE